MTLKICSGQGNWNVDNVRDSWSQLLSLARNMHVRHQIPSMIYAIMTGLPFESSSSVEDFRQDDLPSFAEVITVIVTLQTLCSTQFVRSTS